MNWWETPFWTSVITIIITASLASIPSLISGWVARRKAIEELPLDRKKVNGEYKEKVSSAYDLLVENLREEITRMKANNAEEVALIRKDLDREIEFRRDQEKRISKLEKGVKILVKQLREQNIEPAFTLD